SGSPSPPPWAPFSSRRSATLRATCSNHPPGSTIHAPAGLAPEAPRVSRRRERPGNEQRLHPPGDDLHGREEREARVVQAEKAEVTAPHPEPNGFRREAPADYIREAIKEDLRSGRFDRVHTRFPPEPNAYLHIGHAKAVWIDYGIAVDFGGLFNLRF